MSGGSSRQLLQEGGKKQLVPCSKERYSFWTFSHQEPRRITRFDVRPRSLVLQHYNLQVRPWISLRDCQSRGRATPPPVVKLASAAVHHREAPGNSVPANTSGST